MAKSLKDRAYRAEHCRREDLRELSATTVFYMKLVFLLMVNKAELMCRSSKYGLFSTYSVTH